MPRRIVGWRLRNPPPAPPASKPAPPKPDDAEARQRKQWKQEVEDVDKQNRQKSPSLWTSEEKVTGLLDNIAPDLKTDPEGWKTVVGTAEATQLKPR